MKSVCHGQISARFFVWGLPDSLVLWRWGLKRPIWVGKEREERSRHRDRTKAGRLAAPDVRLWGG